MRQRIFIAINLPENIKNRLEKYKEKWPDLPAKWTKKENLHITLEFLGYLSDEEIMDLCQKIKKTAAKKKSFDIRLNRICYGPPKKSLNAGIIPRMVWVTGDRIKEINLNPHITLARIKTWEFRQMETGERPEINEDIDLSFEVNSIEIMESRLKRGGPEYFVLESCELKGQ